MQTRTETVTLSFACHIADPSVIQSLFQAKLNVVITEEVFMFCVYRRDGEDFWFIGILVLMYPSVR